MTENTQNALIDLLSALDKAQEGCATESWAGHENGYGVDFGTELDAAITKGREALTHTAASVAALTQEPVAWAIFTGTGNMRIWSQQRFYVEAIGDREGLPLTPLYAAPQPAASVAAVSFHPACIPDMLVNGGALTLALNVLRRAGKAEVADELEATAQLQPRTPAEPFQNRVQPWLMACFGEMIAGDREERNHRFLEESLELVQSCGCTASEAHQLVDYVFGRPVGEPPQEVGGVMVTLAALCRASGIDMHAAGETELARIWTKVKAIRDKQAAKPKHSPLPMAIEGKDADSRDAGQAEANYWVLDDETITAETFSFTDFAEAKQAAKDHGCGLVAYHQSLTAIQAKGRTS